ncbi:MAG: hypothetical protein K6A73_07665 [Bacteroidales bacterium]|nr:hypothetical protein [Bacteroidales bacterium]
MAINLDKIAKEAELHGKIQMIEGLCKALFHATDGKQTVTENVIETMHDICKQMLDKIDKYYLIEAELRKMQ